MRWFRMIERDDAAILLLPVLDRNFDVPPGVRYLPLSQVSSSLKPGLWVVDSADVYRQSDKLIDWLHLYRPWRHGFLKDYVLASPQRLSECIARFQPELVHSMEIQLAGYLCLETARRMGAAFPPWVLSNWGSDTLMFRKLEEHERRLRAVFRRVNFYLPECNRDLRIARDFGYEGPTLPVIPASGGEDIEAMAQRAKEKPSLRRKIVLKGYHGWSGRSLLALSAITLAHPHLAGYSIEISRASSPVKYWVRRMRRKQKFDIAIAPFLPEHDVAIDRLASARIVMGVGMSDGISTTALEAMAVGALPIQSSTACTDEWIEDGRSGFIVSPYDTKEIARAIVKAVTDDELVDRAAEINLRTVMKRWNINTNRATVWRIYDQARVEKAVERHG